MRALLCALLLGVPVITKAHDLRYEVGAAEAVVVTLGFPYGAPPIYEPYELFRPGQDVAFQVGRSDGAGRITFAPDTPGRWRLRLTTEDGHGLELAIDVDAAATVQAVHGPGLGRLAAAGAGAGYLLGLGGLLLLWQQRKRR